MTLKEEAYREQFRCFVIHFEVQCSQCLRVNPCTYKKWRRDYRMLKTCLQDSKNRYWLNFDAHYLDVTQCIVKIEKSKFHFDDGNVLKILFEVNYYLTIMVMKELDVRGDKSIPTFLSSFLLLYKKNEVEIINAELVLFYLLFFFFKHSHIFFTNSFWLAPNRICHPGLLLRSATGCD